MLRIDSSPYISSILAPFKLGDRMRAGLFTCVVALLIAGRPMAQDFQSPEVLFKKAYDAEYSHDPTKPDLDRAVDYYGRALNRAQEILGREEARDEAEKSEIRIQYCIEWAVKSLASRARCYEKMTPPNVSGALGDYREILSSWRDRAPEKVHDLLALAQDKSDRNGVDILLNSFVRKIDEWRRHGRIHPGALEREKESVLADLNDMKGLIQTLDHKEDQVLSMINDKLQRVCNEEGIVMLIEKLADKRYQRGASLALQGIMERYSRAQALESAANKAEFRIKYIPDNPFKARIYESEVSSPRQQARQERFDLPESIDSPRIFEALGKVIVDESLDEGARTSAILVLTGFDRLQTEAVDVLLIVLQDVNSRVRAAAAEACARVNTQQSEDKHRLADMLMKLVVYEPVNDLDLEKERMSIEQETHPELQELLSKLAEAHMGRDKDAQEMARNALETRKRELVHGVLSKLANSDLVREKAAISLGIMGVIKAIPSLVDAMDDNAAIVRSAAHRALVQICDPLARVRDATKELPFRIPFHPMSPRSDSSKQSQLRQLEAERGKVPAEKPEYGEAIDKKIALLTASRPFEEGQKEWQQWWESTRGVEILVTAFDTFAREWNFYQPEEVYDVTGFRIKIEAEARFSVDPANERERAEAVIKEFHEDHVRFHIIDIVDLVSKATDPQIGKDVVEWLYKFLDGKVQGRPDVKDVTRIFVGNCLSAVIVAKSDDEAREKIRNVVLGNIAERPEIKTGATYVCAYYPRDLEQIELDRTAVEQALRDGNLKVRLAACYASGMIGVARTAKELGGKIRDAEKEVRLAAARAIARIAGDEGQARHLGQDKDFMQRVGERIHHETDDPNAPSTVREPDPEVRAEICFAFGTIGHRNAFEYLKRARRDMDERVRYAASVANRRIGAKDPQSANILWGFYAPEGQGPPKFSDREGAILSMGDLNSKEYVAQFCERLIGSGSEPWRSWEPHQRVRRAIALALGEVGHKSPRVRDTLQQALLDPAEEVRAASYLSLNKLVGGGLSSVREDVIFTGRGDERTQIKVEFMAKLPRDVLERYHRSIGNWLQTNARDVFKDPDQ
jgi:HEAT repeat protein